MTDVARAAASIVSSAIARASASRSMPGTERRDFPTAAGFTGMTSDHA
ncbi:hypothetical protein [Microbacterium halophytorum]|nr:hypothetical protein [Microbacterium halophytorum]